MNVTMRVEAGKLRIEAMDPEAGYCLAQLAESIWQEGGEVQTDVTGSSCVLFLPLADRPA